MKKIQSYRELLIWNKGIEIVEKIYKITSKLTKTERYILATQMQRAAISIPSNIAEGFMRNHTKEYIQFLFVVLGSCAELETQLVITEKLAYVSTNENSPIYKELEYEGKMVRNLIKSLQAKSL